MSVPDTEGIVTLGSPLGIGPTTATPCAWRSAAALTMMPATTTISAPGHRGRNRFNKSTATIELTPTTNDASSMSPRCVTK